MERVSGLTLSQFTEQHLPVPREAARLIARLARAVAFLHAKGIIHQDITPRNVLIDENGQPRLIDFGLARLRHAWTDDADGSTGGTANYMSPEQALGREDQIGPWTDIFGLGSVLYHLLTGRPLYQSTSPSSALWQASRGEQVSPREINPRVPRSLEKICLKALAPHPQQRYCSAGELERTLSRFLARPWIAGAGVIVLGLLAVGLTTRAMRNDRPLNVQTPPLPITVAIPTPKVVSFEIEHLRGNPPIVLGTIGLASLSAQYDDDVRILTRLDAQAYCYLIALNPDGNVRLCHPSDQSLPPLKAKEVAYPSEPSKAFPLNDGIGLQAFVALAAREPLPPYEGWKSHLELAWKRLPAEGGWQFDGRWIYPLGSGPRGEPREIVDAPQPFRELCDQLTKLPGVDAIHVVAFPVRAVH